MAAPCSRNRAPAWPIDVRRPLKLRATSIAAWREVEGTISADQSLETRETQFGIAIEEARCGARTRRARIFEGVATLFDLIDAFTRRIDAERGLITARERVSNRITYHVALGGGLHWRRRRRPGTRAMNKMDLNMTSQTAQDEDKPRGFLGRRASDFRAPAIVDRGGGPGLLGIDGDGSKPEEKGEAAAPACGYLASPIRGRRRSHSTCKAKRARAWATLASQVAGRLV